MYGWGPGSKALVVATSVLEKVLVLCYQVSLLMNKSLHSCYAYVVLSISPQSYAQIESSPLDPFHDQSHWVVVVCDIRISILVVVSCKARWCRFRPHLVRKRYKFFGLRSVKRENLQSLHAIHWEVMVRVASVHGYKSKISEVLMNFSKHHNRGFNTASQSYRG